MVRAISYKQAFNGMIRSNHPTLTRERFAFGWSRSAAMIFLTLVVGGATRLTESGLSIVEWKPVTGVLPPLSESDWQAEFTKYQAIPQYRELNRGMSLDAFKTIYWWEWSHRLLARATGAVFLLPFLFFLWRGWIPPELRNRGCGRFSAGGAALGAVGWWMVSSGLSGTLTSVSQYRLAFHLTLGLRDLCGGPVDGTASLAATGRHCIAARPQWRASRGGTGSAADLSRRTGGRARCRV